MRAARLFGVFAGLLAVLAVSANAPRQEDAERKALYEWFDSLGFSSLETGQFGEIQRWTTWTGKKESRPSEFGFLERSEGKSFSALLLGLYSVSYPSGKELYSVEEHASFHPIALKTWLDGQKRLWATPAATWEDPHAYSLGYYPMAEEFLLARVADLHGYRDLADWFYDAAKKTEASNEEERAKPFAERVKYFLAEGLLGQAKAAFGVLTLDRTKLLDKMNFIVDHFPESPFRREAQDHAEVLKEMVKEDAVRKPLSRPQWSRLSPEGKARELVWQLRNQNSVQGMNPGYTAMVGFVGFSPSGFSPAADVVKLRFAAISPLIEALRDKRFTRSVNRSGRVLRIRDAAVQILTEIALRSFSEDPEGVHDDSDATAAKILTKVKAWWSEAQAVGEERMLMQGVSKGDSDGARQAELLAKAYPASALGPVKSGVSRAKEPYVRGQLIRALGYVHSAEALRYARDQMTHGVDIDARLPAAEVVYKVDPMSAVEAMIREWRTNPTPASYFGGVDNLVRFLAESGRLIAAKALAYRLRSRPIETRLEVVQQLEMELPDPRFPGEKPAPARERPLFARASEDLLAGELTDQEARLGMSGSSGDFSFEDPRVCDMAAHVLASAWPKRYGFKNVLSERSRDAQCLHNLNTWRKSRGLWPLPYPLRPVVQDLSGTVLQGPFARLRAGQNPSLELERLGLGALKPLVRFQKTLPEPQKKQAGVVAAHLANIVREVKFKRMPKGAGAFAQRVLALKGKPLSGAAFCDLVLEILHKWPGGIRGGYVTAIREDDGTGIVLSVDLGLSGSPYDTGQTDWDERIQAGNERLGNGGGGGDEDRVVDDELRKAVHKAFSSPPLVPVIVSMAVHRGRRR